MNKIVLIVGLFSLMCCCTMAATIKGKLLDENKEPLTGATVLLDSDNKLYAIAGLDGTYAIKGVAVGTHIVKVSFIGYQTQERTITISSESDVIIIDFDLALDSKVLNEIVVSSDGYPGSEAEARTKERNAPQVMNALSAKAISLLPDLSVANLVQRMSGLTVQRNGNGDPQYAIVRGMDKRYNYTLVNGLKIPSPDSKNRYVPLDIFPSNMLERLEVYKSLTADMEGDAIGGVVNMVMKTAPDHFEVKADFQTGYNYINKLYGFDHYNSSETMKQSPRQMYGTGYAAQLADFSQTVRVQNNNPIPDMIGSLSVGNRFFKNKLGVLVGGSFQNSYRATKSIWFDEDVDPYGSDLPQLSALQERHYSIQQKRAAAHTRLDFKFNGNNEIKFYAGYYLLDNDETRMIRESSLKLGYSSAQGNASMNYETRTKTTDQGIFTSSLQGNHKLFEPLTLNWSAVYSRANNNEPDNAEFTTSTTMINFKETPQGAEELTRQWLNNTDTDLTGYLNLIFQPQSWGNSLLKAGGMMRHKDRSSNYDIYYFEPNPVQQFQGTNWNTVDDVTWSLTDPLGAANDALNFNAHEYINAAYALGKLDVEKWEVNAGVRVEQTNQGYALKNPNQGVTPDSTQHYVDVLPSMMAKYKIKPGINLRFSYYKGLSRPSFFEIVPYIYPDDGYPEHGNTKLQRVKAQNVDLRWELFPNPTDQILVGAFYKYITNPIEYTVTKWSVANEDVWQPNNFGNAQNMGVEVDFTHYFNKFGIRANYTYTHSTITTTKQLLGPVDPTDLTKGYTTYIVNQTRPMQGQAPHIGNLSLLYKDVTKGWEAQLSLVYNSSKLEAVSPYLDNDMYSKPIVMLDFSGEKKVSKMIDVFIKATNLLNSAYQMYIKKPVYVTQNNDYPYQNDPQHKTLTRRDEYYQSFRAGIRIKFSKD